MKSETPLRSAAEVAELAAAHTGLVSYVARRLRTSQRLGMPREDAIGAGTVGLMEAATRWDPARGRAFSTLAMPRIRGAILDELRRHRGKQGTGRAAARAVPLDPEIPARTETPDTLLGRIDLGRALEQLEPKERRVIELRYWGGRQFAEIAETMELGEPWVWALHKRALGKLRQRLAA
jgi:RNA polymerase sigma factor (sigma-70 family)